MKRVPDSIEGSARGTPGVKRCENPTGSSDFGVMSWQAFEKTFFKNLWPIGLWVSYLPIALLPYCECERVSICFVGGGDVKHTIGVNVNVKGDLDRRDTTRICPGGCCPSLVVGVSGEGLGIREDGDVALDEGDHDTTGGLDTERGGSDVEEEVLGLLRGVAGEMGEYWVRTKFSNWPVEVGLEFGQNLSTMLGAQIKKFGHQIHCYQRSDRRSDNAVALYPVPYSMSFAMQAIERRIKQYISALEFTDNGKRKMLCRKFELLRHHQGSNVEAVNEFRDHVEISLRAQRIFEELSAEKEILYLGKAVASLNTMRRKGKANSNIASQQKWAEYMLAINGKPRNWGRGMNECSATQKKAAMGQIRIQAT
ncbi:hypothetical protein B0H13DRAFT_2271691 [Mycena leptocephala]|nr:hypothetical protein B0H13DRAFT_2271691 [Mycena leptocephala]